MAKKFTTNTRVQISKNKEPILNLLTELINNTPEYLNTYHNFYHEKLIKK